MISTVTLFGLRVSVFGFRPSSRPPLGLHGHVSFRSAAPLHRLRLSRWRAARHDLPDPPGRTERGRYQAVLVTGSGVTAKVTECYRRLNNQELQLLNAQVKALKQAMTNSHSAFPSSPESARMMSESPMMMSAMVDQPRTLIQHRDPSNSRPSLSHRGADRRSRSQPRPARPCLAGDRRSHRRAGCRAR